MREVCYSWCSLFFSLLRIAQKAVDESRKEARQKAGASGRRRVTQPSGGEIRVLLACLTRLGGRRTGVEAPVMTADPTRWQLRFRLTAKPPNRLRHWIPGRSPTLVGGLLTKMEEKESDIKGVGLMGGRA